MEQTTQTTGESVSPQRPGDHVLLTVLGTNPRETRYVFRSKASAASLAPVALLDLLPDSEQPSHVLALCTPKAERESWTLLKDALGDRYQTTLVSIPADVPPEEQVNAYLEKVVEKVVEVVPCDAGITVDVTHGFRHFSFLTYIAVLYLASLRRIEVRGAYYGLLNRDGSSPFLDLRPLLKLPGWIHALQVMDETGSTLPMAKVLKDGLQGKSLNQARGIESDLIQLSQGYLSGLPLELGRQARRIHEQHLNTLGKLLTNDHRLPLVKELLDRFDDILKPLAFGDAPALGGEGWKGRIMLREHELQRQAQFIDELLKRKNMATALGLLSEWTISWVIWRMGYKEQWLDYSKGRRRAANLLGAVRAISVGDHGDLKTTLTQELLDLGAYWQALSNLRNGYAHHGMRRQDLLNQAQNNNEMQKVLHYWQTLRHCPRFSLSLGGDHGRILVSPIGMRPGVLFSALQICRTEKGCGEPARCLVICSQETQGKIAETMEKAAYSGDVEPLCLNPYGDFNEVKRLERASRQHFIGASEVVVNVTGGTTLMGLAAEALASTARGLACPVRRFGLIDRRSPHEQDADPYKMGEEFWLDRPMHSDAADEH